MHQKVDGGITCAVEAGAAIDSSSVHHLLHVGGVAVVTALRAQQHRPRFKFAVWRIETLAGVAFRDGLALVRQKLTCPENNMLRNFNLINTNMN